MRMHSRQPTVNLRKFQGVRCDKTCGIIIGYSWRWSLVGGTREQCGLRQGPRQVSSHPGVGVERHSSTAVRI